jgi:pseudaminic acid synthase
VGCPPPEGVDVVYPRDARRDISDAVDAVRRVRNGQLVLLKCTSAYPAPPEEMNLRTISDLWRRFGVPAGLSDDALGTAVPVAAVSVGACMVEKYLTLSRSVPGPDSQFSIEPDEFKKMIEDIRTAERALGGVCYDVSERERASKVFRRSLFVVRDIQAGEVFTMNNVRSIRPADGLPPKFLNEVLGSKTAVDPKRGTPRLGSGEPEAPLEVSVAPLTTVRPLA